MWVSFARVILIVVSLAYPKNVDSLVEYIEHKGNTVYYHLVKQTVIMMLANMSKSLFTICICFDSETILLFTYEYGV